MNRKIEGDIVAKNISDEENEFNKIKNLQKIKLFIWEFLKYFIAILNSVAAMASIVGLLLSIVAKEKMAIVFYASIGIFVTVILFTIFATIKSSKNDKMKEVNKYAKGFHDILHLIRDCYGDLMDVTEEETYNRPLVFRKYMTERVMKMMDSLARNLTEATGYKVRACGKVMGSDPIKKE